MSPETWQGYFKNIYSKAFSTKDQFFQYRVMHRTLVTREKLYEWKMSESDLCTFCDEEIETIEHLFLECEVIKAFFKKILNWFKYKTGMLVTVTNEQLLFGNTAVKIIDFVLLQAKKYVYFCRCNGKFPSIVALESRLKCIYQIEKFIATKNDEINEFQAR